MQQERSFLRRVKCLRPFIYENYPSSRRAYFSIRLAVKTSRPHFFSIQYSVFSVQFVRLNLRTAVYLLLQIYGNLGEFPMFTKRLGSIFECFSH